jgi:hypothetical protein
MMSNNDASNNIVGFNACLELPTAATVVTQILVSKKTQMVQRDHQFEHAISKL